MFACSIELIVQLPASVYQFHVIQYQLLQLVLYRTRAL